jgi:DNA polymerase-3 subunit delta'
MFDKLAGNQRVKEVLRRMLEARRVPGSLLFAGEEGVGKKLFALELAKALNCLAPRGVEACELCASCVRISRSTFAPYADEDSNKDKIVWAEHADVGLVRPFKRLIRIAPMRELEREANFRPFEGKARVFLIEDADKLNDHSSNALLKTLEEPPRTSHLILLTSRPSALLPTIRSRCQMLRFAPLAPAEIEAHLKRDKKMSATDASLLARAARGSLGRALSTDLKNYQEQREAMLSILHALAVAGDRARLLRATEEMTDAKHKDEYEPRLEVLATLIHDVWAIGMGAPEAKIVNSDIGAQLSEISARTTSRRAARWLTQIENVREQLVVNINRKVATDALFLAMIEA